MYWFLDLICNDGHKINIKIYQDDTLIPKIFLICAINSPPHHISRTTATRVAAAAKRVTEYVAQQLVKSVGLLPPLPAPFPSSACEIKANSALKSPFCPSSPPVRASAAAAAADPGPLHSSEVQKHTRPVLSLWHHFPPFSLVLRITPSHSAGALLQSPQSCAWTPGKRLRCRIRFQL